VADLFFPVVFPHEEDHRPLPLFGDLSSKTAWPKREGRKGGKRYHAAPLSSGTKYFSPPFSEFLEV